MKMEQMLLHRKQRSTLYALCVWHEEISISVGLRVIAEEKISLKRNQESVKCAWKVWKQDSLPFKSIGVLTAETKSRVRFTMFRNWFDNWRQSCEIKKRVQMQVRMNNVKTIVEQILTGKLTDAWKFFKQDISRGE